MTATSTNRAPTHRAYVTKGDGDQTRWTEIGAAWPHKDGHGLTIQLDAAPVDGRIVMRELAERADGCQR